MAQDVLTPNQAWARLETLRALEDLLENDKTMTILEAIRVHAAVEKIRKELGMPPLTKKEQSNEQ